MTKEERPLQGTETCGTIPSYMDTNHAGCDTVARGVGSLGRANIVPTMFGGHCYYVRKCVRPEQDGGIFLPEAVYTKVVVESVDEETGRMSRKETGRWNDLQNNVCAVEVLAKGRRVGKVCSERHAKRFKRPVWLYDDVEVGDLLLCPQGEHEGIRRSPLAEFEYFIEESVPYAKVGDADGLEPVAAGA